MNENVWDTHGTRILGAVIAGIGALQGYVNGGAFTGLVSPQAVGWLGIVLGTLTAVLGGLTYARGASNAAQAKVAQAMETAIRATPPQGGFARPLMLALLLAVSLPVVGALQGCASIGLAQPQSFEHRWAYTKAQVIGLREASTKALEAKLIDAEDMRYCISVADKSTQLLVLAQQAKNVGDLSTAEARLLLVSNILTELEQYLQKRSAPR